MTTRETPACHPERGVHTRRKPKIAVLVDAYLPGHKFGGPIRSISALVERLSNTFEFQIITRDRDLGDLYPYPDKTVDDWQMVGKARVFYASPETLRPRRLRRVLSDCQYDLLYCNSLFSPRLTTQVLALRRLRCIPYTPVIVAPRGELSRGAIAIKRSKKKAFLAVAHAAGIYRDVVWHASTEHERADILATIGSATSARLEIAPVMSEFSKPDQQALGRRPKEPGSLRIVFLSRIARKKNLAGALRILAHVPGRIEFAIYGPVEDHLYWAQCLTLTSQLPPRVTVSYRGAVTHAQVASILADNDLFFLPTYGENFGHAIFEALAAGCPVLVSDQTAWRNLEASGAGWDIPISEQARFVEVLAKCVAMDASAHVKMSEAAMHLARTTMLAGDVLERNQKLFERALLLGAKR